MTRGATGGTRGGTLILGGGFAGSYVARLLKEHGATIVSPENFMLYTPLLSEAARARSSPGTSSSLSASEGASAITPAVA